MQKLEVSKADYERILRALRDSAANAAQAARTYRRRGDLGAADGLESEAAARRTLESELRSQECN